MEISRLARRVDTKFKLSHAFLPSQGSSRQFGRSRPLDAPSPQPFRTALQCPLSDDCLTKTPTVEGIDRKKPLLGTVPPYTRHVVINTAKTNWAARIENDEGPKLARTLKELLGPKGEFHNPESSVLITNSSFPLLESQDTFAHSIDDRFVEFLDDRGKIDETEEAFDSSGNVGSDENLTSIYTFPDFQYISGIENSTESYYNVAKYLSQSSTQVGTTSQNSTPPNESSPPMETSPLQPQSSITPVVQPIVLICGHGTRDHRCGSLGPVLMQEFNYNLEDADNGFPHFKIALVSHVGGHALAGNVIIYIPQKPIERGFESDHPLGGMGIWYGRVESPHVKGILQKTLLEGKVVRDLFRGGIGRHGEALRL